MSVSRKKPSSQPLEWAKSRLSSSKQNEGNVGGSEVSLRDCFPDHTDAQIWEFEYSSGGSHREYEDRGERIGWAGRPVLAVDRLVIVFDWTLCIIDQITPNSLRKVPH